MSSSKEYNPYASDKSAGTSGSNSLERVKNMKPVEDFALSLTPVGRNPDEHVRSISENYEHKRVHLN